MRTSRRFIVPVAVAAVALALGLAAALWDRAPREASALLALSLPDTQGTEQPLRQWVGKVLVVNFWATWCEPCREEMPEFVRAQRDLGAQGVQFVGIAVDDRDKVVQFTRELHLNYPALIGGYKAMDTVKPLGNNLSVLPFTVILDRQGRVAHTQLGPLEKGQLRSILSNLL